MSSCRDQHCPDTTTTITMKTTVAVTLAVLINNSFVFFSADQDRSSLSIRASGKIQSAHEVSEIINISLI